MSAQGGCGTGNDRLTGGAGHDRLDGSAGNDVLVFNTPPSKTNWDIISRFSNTPGNHDVNHLDNAYMPALGAPGKLDPDFFSVSGVARDRDDHVFYNKNTGALYYDANGNLPGGVTHIASLIDRPVLTANDFLVI